MARWRGSARSKYGPKRSWTSSKRSAQLRRSSTEGNTSISSSLCLFPSFYHISAAVVLVLHSSKAIGKEATTIARRLGRPAPHPGFGPQVELSSRDTGGLLDLLGIGKTLSWKPHHAGRGATSPPGD